MFKGEIIALTVAIVWTICAIFAEIASRRLGTLCFNALRMTMSLPVLLGVLWWFMGAPYPVGADATTWLWLALSGLVGYVFGDFCLIKSYLLIGSRHGQLLMTLAPPTAAFFSWMLLRQTMHATAIIGMLITMFGIILAIGHNRQDGDKVQKLPMRGILFGIGAAVGQGLGLVLSAKGLWHYEQCINSLGSTFKHGANVDIIIPFAATTIRAIVGCLGFVTLVVAKKQTVELLHAVHDKRGFYATFAATITGPVIGVGLSLMATLYTAVGIAQTIMSLTPVLIIVPTYLIFHQKIHWQEVVGAIISVCGVALFFSVH